MARLQCATAIEISGPAWWRLYGTPSNSPGRLLADHRAKGGYPPHPGEETPDVPDALDANDVLKGFGVGWRGMSRVELNL